MRPPFWIREDEEDQNPALARALAGCTDPRTGRAAHIVRVQSLHPASMEAHYHLYHTLLHGPSPLSRRQREMIAVVVSATNGCHYRVVHHGESLRGLTSEPTLLPLLREDYRKAPLSPADRAMLDYAVRLTRSPEAITSSDVQRLREAGFEDRAILDIVQVTAYFAFANRLTLGLGVELEAERKKNLEEEP